MSSLFQSVLCPFLGVIFSYVFRCLLSSLCLKQVSVAWTGFLCLFALSAWTSWEPSVLLLLLLCPFDGAGWRSVHCSCKLLWITTACFILFNCREACCRHLILQHYILGLDVAVDILTFHSLCVCWMFFVVGIFSSRFVSLFFSEWALFPTEMTESTFWVCVLPVLHFAGSRASIVLLE